MAKSQQFPFQKGWVTKNHNLCRSFINDTSGEKKTNRAAHNNQKAYFFCHLIPAEYFTDTHDWLVIGFLCVVNEKRQVEVDSKWKWGGVQKKEGPVKRGDQFMVSSVVFRELEPK